MPKVAQPDLDAFGKAVKRARALKGWGLDQLAAAITPSPGKSFLSNIENGKRAISAPTVGKLIRALDLPEHWIDAFLDAGTDPRNEVTPTDQGTDRLLALAAQDATAPHVNEPLLLQLAQTWAPQALTDPAAAYAALHEMLKAADRIERRGQMPSNHGDALQAVLAEVARLNNDLRRDDADAVLTSALAEERQGSNARQSTLLDALIDQSRLRNNPASAARHLVARLHLDAPGDPFAALRTLQDEWYVAGRDKGLNFELAVSIDLARHGQTLADTPDQRGAALNDLGVSLLELGCRETAPARLEQAVAAYTEALTERTRDRVPLGWAATQNNLGAALYELGRRETGPARLKQAVAAYTAALTEYTRDRVPLDWAMTQNNLGNALSVLGTRETAPARLEQAVVAYTEALKERTRDRVPLDWAMTQNNLGNALSVLGTRETAPARLEQAIAAYTEALTEYTRDRVPLDWAAIQNNLGAALYALGTLETAPARLEQAVAAYTEALKERTRDRVPLDWAMSFGNQGVAFCALAGLTADAAMAARALDQLTEAEALMRDAGHVPLADYYAGQIPLAQALIARLS